MARQSTFNKEKIWLALIPVIGAIIVALITIKPFSPSQKNTKPLFNDLRSKAGKINDLVIYDDYN